MAEFREYDKIMKDLGKYKTGSSCLYVKKLSDIDLKKLEVLIKKPVAYLKERYA